jgi:hypothetical protein
MHARLRGAILIAAAMIPGLALGQPAAPDPSAPTATPATPEATADRPADDSGAPTTPAVPAAPPPAAPPAAPRFQWAPFGYLRLQYAMVQNDPGVAFVGRDDGFELQNARIGVRGTLDERVAFVVAIDGAVDERLQINTPDGKLEARLRDAFADVVIAGKLVARGGFFHAFVDPEALVADTRRALVDKPIESRGIRATEGFETAGLTPGRSLGAALRIDPAPPASGVRLGFELAVQNGADELSSNNDNDKPAVSATLLARLARGGWVMVAGRYNPRSLGNLPFRQDEDDLQGTAGLRVALGPIALSGGVITQRTTFATTDGPSQTAFGGHGQVMVAIPTGLPLSVGYRFGILNPSSLVPTDRVIEHTVGAVLAVPRYRMRVQLQVTHVVEQAARELSNDRAQLAAELEL